MKYYELFEILEKMPGRKDKEDLILEHKSTYLMDIFDRVFNPFKQCYTNKFIKKPIEGIERRYNEAIDIVKLFDFLNSLGSTSNKSKNEVYWYMHYEQQLNEIKAKWDKRILMKDLKIGISDKTINKIFDNYIPSFDVMLCKKVDKLDDLKFPLFAQPKLDGIRCLKIGEALTSRNGKAISNEKLYNHLKDIFTYTGSVFDGELYSHEIGFNEILSQINSDDKELHSSIKYVVFDMVSDEEWKDKDCISGYQERLKGVEEVVKDFKNCEAVGNKEVNSLEEMNEFYEECLKNGYEGIMVKGMDSPYEWKRVNQDVMGKVKPTETFDCKIIDIKEGTGKYEKNFGAFVVDYNGVNVNCGSGYSDKQRKEFWNNKANLLGHWISVKAQEETKDGSLRFPIFERLRDDKK